MAHILIVEDQLSLNRILNHYFVSKGFSVEKAFTAAEGIAKGTHREYDILIADLSLPDGDGIRVIELIKKKYPHTVPIVITGIGTLDSAIEALRLDALDYLVKPFTLERIKTAVSRGLEKKQRYETCEKKQCEFWTIIHQVRNKLGVIVAAAAIAGEVLDDQEQLKKQLSSIAETSSDIARICSTRELEGIKDTITGNRNFCLKE